MLIRSIENLSKAVQSIEYGKYSERVNVDSRDEIGLIGKKFNSMAMEIHNTVEALREEGERKQRFVDNLAHELRTPLTSIIGYSELTLQTRCDGEITRKSLEKINSEGKRILRMTNKLMDMILFRKNPWVLENQSIIPILEEVTQAIDIKAKEREIALNVEGDDFMLMVDRDLIKEAILNLVDNSLKASKPGGEITIGARQDMNRRFIYVRDEGVGMEEEEIKKVQEPFYKVDKSRTRKRGGFGLGLALTKEIVRGHDADLDIESEPSKGTTVKIIFKS